MYVCILEEIMIGRACKEWMGRDCLRGYRMKKKKMVERKEDDQS